jgi:hypothetical protein
MRPFIDLAAGCFGLVALYFLFDALAPGPQHRKTYSLIWFITLIAAGILALGNPLVGLAALAAGVGLRVWVATRLQPPRAPTGRR